MPDAGWIAGYRRIGSGRDSIKRQYQLPEIGHAFMPDPKYALEGNTHDGQHVRIIFANSPRGPVVVTVIDLEKEW